MFRPLVRRLSASHKPEWRDGRRVRARRPGDCDLKVDITVGIIVDAFEQLQCDRATARRIKRFMKLPVQVTPVFNVAFRERFVSQLFCTT